MRISDWSSDVCSSDLFNTGVATANNCHTLALEQRTIAVRAVGHTVVAVFALAGHVDFAPARAGCQDDSLAFHDAAIGQTDFDQALAKHQRLGRSEEHTSELQSLMRISYAVFCLKKKKHTRKTQHKRKP